MSAQHELRAILRQVTRSGIGLILVTHHLPDIIPEIELVVRMRNGRIVGDGPKQKLLAGETLEQLFGVHVKHGSARRLLPPVVTIIRPAP